MQEQKVELGTTPEETKENIVKALQKDVNAEEDAFGVAATMFGIYLPRFKAKIRQMNSKARERVLFALVEVPIAEKDYNPITKDEREAFLIGQSLLEAKMLMIMHTLRTNEEAKLASAVEAPSDTTETTNETENT
jgi:hypothetical protein